jgi:hypothetical protein
MKKLFVKLTLLAIITNQAFAMEPLEQEDADAVTIQIANQSQYPVLAFFRKARSREGHRGEHAQVYKPRSAHATFESDSQCYERMLMTAETDSEPFTLDSEGQLIISFAQGLYHISNSYEIKEWPNKSAIRTDLYTYNSPKYPSRVTTLEDAPKIMVIINPNGEIQLVKMQ